MTVIYPRGTRVVCQNCGKELLELKKDRTGGDYVSAEDFVVLGEQEKYVDDEVLVCHSCSKPTGISNLRKPEDRLYGS